MSDQVQSGLEAPPAGGAQTAPASPRAGAGVVLAALLAAAASIGLAYWLGSPDRAQPQTAAAPPAPRAPLPIDRAPAPAAPPAPLRYADMAPDVVQIRRAYAEVRRARAAGGDVALFRTSVSCAKTLAGDPSVLDFCLAFDAYAARAMRNAPADTAARGWFAAAPERDLALVRTALPPGADARERLARDQDIARSLIPRPRPRPLAVQPVPATPLPVARPVHRPAHAVHPAPHRSAPLRRPAARSRPHGGLTQSIDRFLRRLTGAPPLPHSGSCRGAATRTERTLCAHPRLADADRRMRNAYDNAIDAGADPDTLARNQSRWLKSRDSARSAARMAELYRRRTQQLEALSRPD